MKRPTPPEHLDHPPQARAPRPRWLGLPWPMLVRPRPLVASIASHVGVALVAAAAIQLLPPRPATGPEPPPPRELSVDLRGGVPTPDDPPEIHGFSPHDRMGVVVRHNGRRSDHARLLVRAEPLSDVSARAAPDPEVYVALDPRRVVWRGQALRFEGTAGEILPLRPGLWRLTIIISDARACAGPPLHVCAQTEAWLRLL